MTITSVSNASQAVASYAAQLQSAQSRSPTREMEPRTQEQGQRPETGERVTLSTQSVPGAGQTNELQMNRDNELERTASTQAVERRQLNDPEATRSAASKSVTRALEAYVQTSMI